MTRHIVIIILIIISILNKHDCLKLCMTISKAKVSSNSSEIRSFLNSLLSSRTTSEKKVELIQKLNTLRNFQSRNLSYVGSSDHSSIWDGSYTNFLDQLLQEVDSIKVNKFAMFNHIIPIPSYRVKLGCLNRVLDIFIADEIKGIKDLPNNDISNSRRRALSAILFQLQKNKSIRSLERDASKSTADVSIEEMLQRTPKLETPLYTVVDARKYWEVREYKEFSCCSTVMSNESGFNTLAGYIFGKNQLNETMAMTTPVISQSLADGSVRKMSFIMPSRFWDNGSQSAPPKPVDNKVVIETKGGGVLEKTTTLAVIYFGGYASENQVNLYKQKLISALNDDNMWKMKDDATLPFIFQYNDPFQPPWSRRNEIAINVVHK